jgi:general stress protein 26
MNLSDEQKIISIMKDNFLFASLSTSDGDQPRVRTVSPIVEDDMSIWITTRSTSRKVKQLRENPKICLAFVEPPDGDRDAIVIGEAQIIPDIQKKRKVWNLAPFDLYRHFPDGPTSSDFCLLKIIPKRIEWRDSGTTKLNIYEPPRQ